MRTYIVTIALSFIAGLLTAIFVYCRLFLAALLCLLILFTMIIFNEKTGAFEDLIGRRTRRRLRNIGILIYLLLICLVIALMMSS